MLLLIERLIKSGMPEFTEAILNSWRVGRPGLPDGQPEALEGSVNVVPPGTYAVSGAATLVLVRAVLGLERSRYSGSISTDPDTWGFGPQYTSGTKRWVSRGGLT